MKQLLPAFFFLTILATAIGCRKDAQPLPGPDELARDVYVALYNSGSTTSGYPVNIYDTVTISLSESCPTCIEISTLNITNQAGDKVIHGFIQDNQLIIPDQVFPIQYIDTGGGSGLDAHLLKINGLGQFSGEYSNSESEITITLNRYTKYENDLTFQPWAIRILYLTRI